MLTIAKRFDKTKYMVFGLLFLTTYFSVVAQNIAITNKEGTILFEKGTNLLELGEYKTADSILTLALEKYVNGSIYFNRAAARLYQNDTIGFCSDISIVADTYFDKEAKRLFNEFCCSEVDTIYYDSKHNIATSAKFKYFEEIRNQKYDSCIIGTYYSKKFKEVTVTDYKIDWEKEIVKFRSMNFIRTNVISMYLLMDSVKLFYNATKPPIMEVEECRKIKINSILFINEKYGHLKSELNVSKISLYYRIKVSDTGDKVGISIYKTIPVIGNKEIIQAIEQDLLLMVRNYPKFEPAQFFNKNVYSLVTEGISF